MRDPDGGAAGRADGAGAGRARGPRRAGLCADAPASVLRRWSHGVADVPAAAARGAPDDVRCARLFGPDSPPGAQLSFRAEREAVARGRRSGGPAGRRRRRRPSRPRRRGAQRAVPRAPEEVELPPPLAEPRLDFRVDRATRAELRGAQGRVHPGASTSRAASARTSSPSTRRKLQRGLERGLDATTTRTLMGNAYPMPGLHGKFYDADMDPLVRGRARHRRPPRHVRRSPARRSTTRTPATSGTSTAPTTSTRALEPFAIARRTRLAGAELLLQHELRRATSSCSPTSRGRAPATTCCCGRLNDLVCSSSACPDDIDPANAWECTDVHVRVYAPRRTGSPWPSPTA